MIPDKVRMIILAMLFSSFGAGSAFVSIVTAISSNYLLSGGMGVAVGASGAFIFYMVSLLCGSEKKS